MNNINYFLLIDSRISDINSITNSLTSNTQYVIFNFDELINIINSFNKNYEAIGIIQHNYNNLLLTIINFC